MGGGMALRPQIIVFGDSITQKSFSTDGWGAHLATQYARKTAVVRPVTNCAEEIRRLRSGHKLMDTLQCTGGIVIRGFQSIALKKIGLRSEKVDVVLRGYSGYNTRWATYLLEKIFPIPSANAPLVVTVFFGANDAALPDRACKDAHVPLAEYKENLHRIISHLKKQSSSTQIILITPPPVDVKGRQVYARSLYGDKADPLAERTNETTRLYAEACETVAAEAAVSVLNIWSIFQQTVNWEEKFLCDGLHLTPQGNVKLFDELRKLLEELGLKWDQLPWDFPEPINIDKKNPARTFGELLS